MGLGKERSLVKKEDWERSRSLENWVSLTPLEFDSNHFLEVEVGINGEWVCILRKKIENSVISKMYS